MFKKMQNRKGFTLIEMMIVIAIIAILVAVIIPVITGSTDKAAAATNASNLRGVEGEIITLMLLEPEAFGDKKSAQEVINQNRENLNKELENIEARDERAQELQDAIELADSLLTAAGDKLSEVTFDENNAHAKCETSFTGTCTQGLSTGDCMKAKFSLSALSHRKCTSSVSGVCSVGGSLDSLSGIGKLIECVGLQATKATYTVLSNEYDKAEVAYNNAVAEYDAYIKKLKDDNKAAQDANDQAQYDLYRYVAVDGVLTISDEVSLEAPGSKAVSTDTLNISEDQQMVVYVDNYNYEAYAYYLSGNEELSAKDFAIAAGNEDLAG